MSASLVGSEMCIRDSPSRASRVNLEACMRGCPHGPLPWVGPPCDSDARLSVRSRFACDGVNGRLIGRNTWTIT
eukprot:4936444-Alexandrium_andersonii.AAC.1